MIDCIYCGERGERSKEHVVPRWLWSALAVLGDHVAPLRGQHAFAGNLPRVPDVCVSCNTGPLRDLDEVARTWWLRRGEALEPVLDAPPPLIL